MADDDIENLLREVDSALGNQAPVKGKPGRPPEPQSGRDADRSDRSDRRSFRGRMRAALPVSLATGVVCAVVVWVLFAVLPFLRADSGGAGAFLAGFVVMFLSRVLRRRPRE
jgi:hypothetical protein